MTSLNDDISLKEVLLSVSQKLDRFLEAHTVLHSSMAAHESKVDTILERHDTYEERISELEKWQNEANGQLKLVKWAVGGGLLSLAALLARLFGVPVP